MDLELPDGTVVQGIPDGLTKAQITNKLVAAGYGKSLSSVADVAMANPTGSFTDNLMAGAGKAVADTGRGLRQLAVEALPGRRMNAYADELRGRADENKRLDAPLMDTGGGISGDITGNIAMALLPGGALKTAGMGARAAGAGNMADALRVAGTSAMVPRSIGGAATQGAAFGAAQPVGTDDSRLYNTALGAGAGAAIPAAAATGRMAKALIDPLYEGGRNNIIGGALRAAAGDNVNPTIAAMQGARELVPGSAPTAAQVAENGGIAAMERAASAANPTPYAERAMEQSAARVQALRGIAGTEPERDMAKAVRSFMSDGFYQMAREEGINPAAAKMMQPQIDNLAARMPAGVMEKARELARIKGETMGPEGSVSGLHYIKKAVDDLLDGAQLTGMGKQMKSALTQFKGDLLATVEELSPKYMQGNRNFATFSQPINQQEVGQYMLNKIQPALADHGALARETGNAYATALRNAETVSKKSTGFAQPLEKVMSESQMRTLNNVAQDLARKANAQDLGRGVGSDTFQKLSMANMAEKSGIPMGALELPGIGRGAKWIYSHADNKMQQALADALLSPQATAKLMRDAAPSQRAAIAALIARRTLQPAMLGASSNSNQ